jgi:hypothetical protein
LGGLGKALHNPYHTQRDQYEETKGNEPHKDHPDPAEWRVAPSSHHARSHHAVSTIASTSDHRAYPKQEEEDDESNNSNDQPVALFHIRVSFHKVWLAVRAVLPIVLYQLAAIWKGAIEDRLKRIDHVISGQDIDYQANQQERKLFGKSGRTVCPRDRTFDGKRFSVDECVHRL